jgi:hypothetical protein
LIGNAEAPQLTLQALARAWRVGEEHDDAALFAEAARGIDGSGKGAHAVVYHPPNIDEPGGVAFAQLYDGAKHWDGVSADGHGLP